MVAYSIPTSEVGGSNPRPYVGKLVVSYRWLAVYSTESLPTVCNDFLCPYRGHSGRVVTLSPPTSEAGVRSPSSPYVGKLVVACRWTAVYSTEH